MCSCTHSTRLTPFEQDTLGLPGNTSIDEESNFLFSGGDSLKALRLCEDILTSTGVTSPQLLEVILDGTFCDVLRHVASVTLMLPPESSSSSQSEVRKRQAKAASAAPAKRECKEPTEAERLDYFEKGAVKVIRRAGDVTEINIGNKEPNKSFKADEHLNELSSDVDVESRALGLSLSWSSDTGRCVDASPVLLVQEGKDAAKTSVFIGSHSHRMQALDLDTGNLLWERVLGGRIEASAAVSQCGRLVVIGQYLLSWNPVEIFYCTVSPSGMIFEFPQVATMAVCISCVPPLEKRSGHLRRATL